MQRAQLEKKTISVFSNHLWKGDGKKRGDIMMQKKNKGDIWASSSEGLHISRKGDGGFQLRLQGGSFVAAEIADQRTIPLIICGKEYAKLENSH